MRVYIHVDGILILLMKLESITQNFLSLSRTLSFLLFLAFALSLSLSLARTCILSLSGSCCLEKKDADLFSLTLHIRAKEACTSTKISHAFDFSYSQYVGS